MFKKKFLSNGWCILYTLIPIVFIVGTMIVIKVQPNIDATMMVYGVKSVKSENAVGYKITQMILTDGKTIDYPTLEDIREHNLLTYHSSKELEDNLVFQSSRLN
ncbi:hypothetical protein [Pseudolactococcus laudensis]|uniref:hypothetical protein n=1 Tax=Pseudolactococcus laudensis TaxID=1494461 RepID=UPI0002775338|nr:hypothetical protein BN193_08460 [Lactococcus raffinolactis 4877]